MPQLDRYLIGQMLGPFGFFALVFTGVLWLTQALRLIDTLISNGQPISTFAEFSALVLPNVMLFVIPLSTFAATLYTLNRLYVESELVVIMMSGRSPWSLIRPLLIFGAGAAGFLLVLTLIVIPASRTQLADRLVEVRSELTNSIMVEGRFVHPAAGVTTYIRDRNAAGEMAGIFIHDARIIDRPVTYSANRAVLVSDGNEAQIVMFEGVTQRLNADQETYGTVVFDRFAFDLTEFVQTGSARIRKPGEYSLATGFNPDPSLLKGHWSRGDFMAEAQEKIVTPLLALVLPILAMGSILAGSFRRGGFSMRMTIGVGLLILMQVLMVVSKSTVSTNWTLWPVAYVPVVAAVSIGLGLIYTASKKKSPRSLRSGGAT